MKRIDLYPEGSGSCPVLEAEAWSVLKTEPLFRHRGAKQVLKEVGVTGPGCTMCSRHKKRTGTDITKPIAMPGATDLSDGSILMVFSFLNYTSSSYLAVEILRELGFKGRIVCDIPVRCGSGNVTDTQIANCNPYLRTTIEKMKPSRIFVFGGVASKAVLGVAMPSSSNRWSWTSIETSWGEVPVIGLMDPVKAATSPIHRAILTNEMRWGWKTDFKAFPRQGQALVPDPSDIPGSLEAIWGWVDKVAKSRPGDPELPWVAYDVETNGVMWTKGFSIIACSLASVRSDDVLVWDQAALEVPEFLNALIDILTDPCIGKRGSNEKYDGLSWLAWKGVVVEPVTGDCRLETKLNNPDASATLEAIGFGVGSNAHKKEAKEFLKDAKKQAALDMDDDMEGVSVMAFAYKYLPVDVLSRYNGLDTRVTAYGCDYSRRSLGPLRKTLDRLTLPAAETTKRIEAKGMLLDMQAISESRYFLESEIEELNKVFRKNDIDPDKPESIRAWLESIGVQSPYETATGLASTSAKALKLIESKNELIAKILEHRKLAKLLHSYAETLPGYVRDDGRVHPSFLLDGARSGRLSCVVGSARMRTSVGEIPLHALGREIQAGPVYARTHLGRWRKVLACWSAGTRDTVTVRTASGLRIRLTPDHLLWTLNGWVRADESVGKMVVNYLDRLELVDSVTPDEPAEVFDFSVEDDHSAVVNDLVVHNCKQPALQTIPSKGKLSKLIKNCFVAAPGYQLVALDFSILEIRIAAYLSQDPDMLKAAQTDYHTETAKRIAKIAWGMTPEQVEAEILSGIKDKRDICKTINFAILYGAGALSIAERVGCSPKEVMKLIGAIVPDNSRLRQWMREQENFARQYGYVEIPWLDGSLGRVRPLLDVNSADGEARGNALRASVNSPVQSLASDICLSSAVKIDGWYRKEKIPANIVCLVHDSIISEVRDDFVDNVTRMKAHLMCDWPTTGVPLKVEAEVGRAWGSMQKVAL